MEKNKDTDMEELELTSKQVERLDEIDNAAFEYLKVLTGNEDLEWNMEFIGELNDFAADMMARAGHRIYYPYIETAPDGTQQRKDYYEPDEPSVKNINGALWDSIRFTGHLEDGRVPDYFEKHTVKVHAFKGGPIEIWARSREEAFEIAETLTEADIRANATHGGVRIESVEKVEGKNG